ncbi:hypothetical protein [Streptomyces abikoensis]|uniref:Toxin n=1 Tax=Streptomyces abikoensis TaxID=97398 RepID=A0ABW7TD50_9ACTN
MDDRRMRRLCADLLRNLAPQRDPGVLFKALCDRMGERHNEPVVHRIVAFPAGTVSGMWVATESQHLVLIEANTAPDHQLVILGHELWHLEDRQSAIRPLPAGETTPLLTPNPDAATVQHIATRMAARTDYCEHDEAEAEYFGSLLGSKARRLLTTAPNSPISQKEAALTHRLETSLGRRRGGQE